MSAGPPGAADALSAGPPGAADALSAGPSGAADAGPSGAGPSDAGPSDAGPAIEATGLVRRFGATRALDGLDLRIAARETFALLGANGAGKTTFLRLVTGTLLPTAGELRVAGLSPASEPDAVRRRLGFVGETVRLYPELRVAGYLRFAAGARGLSGPAREAAVARALERFALGEVARRPIGRLSRGTQQRVSLAQAFLHDPPLVVVDEPGAGLDPLQREEVRAALAERRGERTVLLCTHDLALARELADRVGVLRAGRLVAEGPAAQVLGGGDPLALFRPGAAPPAVGSA